LLLDDDILYYCAVDAFWIQFMVISQLWDSALSFPTTTAFQTLQNIIQKNVSIGTTLAFYLKVYCYCFIVYSELRSRSHIEPQ
jgi:hypothetical protein